MHLFSRSMMKRPSCHRLASCVLVMLAMLFAPLAMSAAWAQACDPLVPVQNPTFEGVGFQEDIGNAAPWTTTTNATTGTAPPGWVKRGGSFAYHVNDFADPSVAISAWNSFQQDISGGVTGGSILVFDLRWNNGGGAEGLGHRIQIEVIYGGVVYARFNTPPRGSLDTDKIGGVTAGTYISGPNWQALPPSTWATYQIQLPAGVPSSAELQVRVRRNTPASTLTPGSAGTDDVDFRNQSILSPTLCLLKQSNDGTGTFSFSTVNADADLGTAGVQTSASITTTTAGTPLAFDAWVGAGAADGLTPLLVVNGANVQITETVPLGFSLDDIVCTGVGTATRSGDSVTVSGISAFSPASCTFVNRLLMADLLLTKTNTPGVNGNVDLTNDTVGPGGTTTYTIRVTNNGPDQVDGAVVTDAPSGALSCPSGNPVTITGDGVPAGSYTVGDLTGGIALGVLVDGETAVLTFTCDVTS